MNRKGHIHAGITGGAFLFKALMENDRDDLIYTMLSKEDYPGWGDMLKRGGATTFFEDWDFRESYLHSSYLYAGAWFIQGLGGIRPGEKAGFKEFVIEPWTDWERGPNQVETHYDSIYGRIVSNWTKRDGEVELKVTVPPNTAATLRVKGIKPAAMQEVASKKHAQVVQSSGSAAYKLEPGTYLFRANK